MLSPIQQFLLPRACYGCGSLLQEGDDGLCLACRMAIPYIDSSHPHNAFANAMVGAVAFEHATALCYYHRESAVSRYITGAKYRVQPDINACLTRILLQHLAGSDWPHDIDVIVPIPVHWLRRLQRGYNQVRIVAETLGKKWHLPVDEGCLYRHIYDRSQVGRSGTERTKRRTDIFGVRHAERLAGRHILLVDDVCTTGNTLTQAADTLRASVPGIRISLLTLALTE